jgi:hypothetical protein
MNWRPVSEYYRKQAASFLQFYSKGVTVLHPLLDAVVHHELLWMRAQAHCIHVGDAFVPHIGL